MSRVLDRLLSRLVRHGDLEVTVAGSAPRRFGDGGGPRVAFRIDSATSARAIALDPNLALGEAYRSGALRMAEGGIYDLVALLMSNTAGVPMPAWLRTLDRLRLAARRIAQRNSTAQARRNVQHHYDIDDRIYALFLDPERQYSCAYFGPGDDLDAAQRRKMAHIAAKLDLEPGQRVLDIGCGWGGLARYLTRAAGADVTGITLSPSQHAYAEAAARREGICGVHFRQQDWREIDGPFDRVVSVGMLEHVGVPHLDDYFQRLARLLDEDGVALIHSIGRSDGPGFTNPFIRRYIFPGGYFPALSEVLPAIERSGLVATDVEILRLHYAETLKAWRERFVARWDEAAAVMGEEFCRTWEFYLAGSEAAFRHQGLIVFQIQLARRIDTLPLTRDYIAAKEQALLAASRRGPWRMAGE